MSRKLNRTSQRITQPKSQGASQAMLYATGLSEEDLDKALDPESMTRPSE